MKMDDVFQYSSDKLYGIQESQEKLITNIHLCMYSHKDIQMEHSIFMGIKFESLFSILEKNSNQL